MVAFCRDIDVLPHHIIIHSEALFQSYHVEFASMPKSPEQRRPLSARRPVVRARRTKRTTQQSNVVTGPRVVLVCTHGRGFLLLTDVWRNVPSLEVSYAFFANQAAFLSQSFPNLRRLSFEGSLPQFLDLRRAILTKFPGIVFSNVDIFWYWLTATPFEEQIREIQRLGLPTRAGPPCIDFFRGIFEHNSMDQLNIMRIQCDVLVVIGQLVCVSRCAYSSCCLHVVRTVPVQRTHCVAMHDQFGHELQSVGGNANKGLDCLPPQHSQGALVFAATKRGHSGIGTFHHAQHHVLF